MKTRLDPLLRISDLRRDLALAGVARALGAVSAAEDAAGQARVEADALADRQARRRQALQAPVLGSAQVRGAVEALLATSRADRDRERLAEEQVNAAAEAVMQARKALDDARAALWQAERKREKRSRMRETLHDALMRDAERRAEEAR